MCIYNYTHVYIYKYMYMEKNAGIYYWLAHVNKHSHTISQEIKRPCLMSASYNRRLTTRLCRFVAVSVPSF